MEIQQSLGQYPALRALTQLVELQLDLKGRHFDSAFISNLLRHSV